MKRTVALGLLLCVLLCGCENKRTDQLPLEDGNTSDVQEETDSQTAGDDDDTETRIAYYESLVTELQKELLQIKTELYENRVAYESRIEELEAKLAQNAFGEETEPEFVYTMSRGGAVITAYLGKAHKVLLPTTIDGYPVIAIGDRAFANRSDLTEVVLPEGVEEIGWFAFSGCVALERITLPSSVTSISYGAFENCTASLTVICHAESYAARYANSYGIRQKTP